MEEVPCAFYLLERHNEGIPDRGDKGGDGKMKLDKEKATVVLQKQQIILLKKRIDKMLTMLERYDTFATAKFRPTLQILSNNIEQCIMYSYDEIEELSRYVFEDWRIVCLGKNGIENWYLNIDDLRLKGRWNEEFEEVVLSVEKILGTNFIVPRKWYSYDDLIRIGRRYKEREKDWDEVIEKLRKENRYYQSPMKQIPNDIWSFAKMLGLAGTENSLKEWFLKDVPAFGYLAPMQILQMENGDDVLRSFMYDVPV